MRYLEEHLKRALLRLERLEAHKEAVRANPGVLHNPSWIDERIEAANRRVVQLRRAVEDAKR